MRRIRQRKRYRRGEVDEENNTEKERQEGRVR